MAWPLSQDYNEAIQSPQTSFSDPELRAGEAAVNALGMPLPCSGNFADVYRINDGAAHRSWAVKCFTRQIPGLRERYQQISLYLPTVRLPFMVDFRFLDQGIRVRGAWYPILKMDWVQGFTLNEFVKDNLDRPPVLETLCQIWVKLAGRLREANIAHCDLQHGNILLVPGAKAGSLSVKLVDYDGMCVPALTLLKSLEVGHPAYQHPQRLREGTYSLEVDRFSHLVIYTALRALCVGGRPLWARYDNGDNLLFRRQDFEAPGSSLLFQELARYQAVRPLAETLKWAAQQPLHLTPLLTALVPEEGSSPNLVPTARVAPQPVPASPGQAPRQGAPAQRTEFEELAPFQTIQTQRGKARKGKTRFWKTFLAGGILAASGLAVFLVLRLGGNSQEASGKSQPKKDDLVKAQPNPGGKEALPQQEDLHKVGPGENKDRQRQTNPGKKKREDLKEKPPSKAREPIKPKPPMPQVVGEIRRIEGSRYPIDFSPDGKLALSGNDDGVFLWNVQTGVRSYQFAGDSYGAVFSPDSKQVATYGRDSFEKRGGQKQELFSIRLWDVRTGKLIRRFHGRKGDPPTCVAFAPDGHRLLASWVEAPAQPGVIKWTGVVRLWEVETGRELRRFDEPNYSIRTLLFSPDGKQAVFASDSVDHKGFLLRIWDVETGAVLRKIEDHEGAWVRVLFSHEWGKIFCINSDQQMTTIRSWDLQTGRPLRSFPGLRGPAQIVVLSPDGRLALTGGYDKTVRLWEVKSGKQLHCFTGHTAYITSVAFSPDGQYCLSASGDKTVRLWGLPVASEGERASKETPVEPEGSKAGKKTQLPKFLKEQPKPEEKTHEETQAVKPQNPPWWKNIELAGVRKREGYVSLDPYARIATNKTFSGPLEITGVARLEYNNLRIHAFNGASLIFNRLFRK